MLLGNLFVWTALVAGPVALAAAELFHPAGFTSEPGAFQYLTNPDLFGGPLPPGRS